MPHLALALLGTFRATLDGERITGFESAKVRALLAYLAVENDRPHARETLAGLLWSQFPNSDALRNLRLALSNLRQAIGDHRADPPFLLITRDTIQFNAASDHSLDVAAILQPPISNLQSPPTARFLDGFSCDSAPFEEWLLLKREQIGQQVLRALRDLTAHCEERGEYEHAQTYARKQLELEPWDEHAHQTLMRALAYGGQRSAALAQYETCRRLLKQELNVAPARETTALYESIRDGKLKRRAPTNVPLPLTSFVGRKREIAEIASLLEDKELHPSREAFRLLTLTGAGGCGKTRLAIHVATELATEERFQHGVWWVDLAALSDPTLVTQAVAMVFNLSESPGVSLRVVLTNYLRAKELLLVIDNCEHLLGACAQLIGTLLSACPKLQIVATSREPLNISGEMVWRVPSLALPDPARIPPLAQLRQYDAIQLFDARATAVVANWRLVENAAPTAQVCARLDGIPLAIELATARLKVLSAEQIAARLDDRFNLLTDGSRIALPRHQTLRATMDWSYGLLSDAERALFRRLGIFVGGFTLDAVEAVCAEENKSEALDLLSQLVSKSLVVSEQSGKSRYHLLETIREYALAKLRDAGETDLYHARHLDYFLKLAEEIAPKLLEADQLTWLNRLETEYDNLRVAARWAEESDNSEAALRLACAIQQFWFMRGYATEARQRFAAVLALPSAHEARLAHQRAWALLYAAVHARTQTDHATADSLGHESLAIFKRFGDKQGTANALHGLGRSAAELGNYASARSFYTKGLTIQRELGNKSGIAQALMQIGFATRELGDYAEGRRLLEEALAMRRELGDKQAIARNLMHLGSAAIAQRDPAARAILEESLAIARELGDKLTAGRTLHDLGQAAAWQGDYELARVRFEESAALLRELGDRRNLVKCVEGLAGIAVAHGQAEKAARLFGASEAVREKLGTPLPASYRANYERTIAALTAQVDEEQMGKWWAEGRMMTFEQAIEYALENPETEKPVFSEKTGFLGNAI